jgi:hypothetical protein
LNGDLELALAMHMRAVGNGTGRKEQQNNWVGSPHSHLSRDDDAEHCQSQAQAVASGLREPGGEIHRRHRGLSPADGCIAALGFGHDRVDKQSSTPFHAAAPIKLSKKRISVINQKGVRT